MSADDIEQELRESYQIKILQNQALIFHRTNRFDLSKQAYLEGIALAQKNNETSDLVSLYGAYFALLLELNQLLEANDILLEMSRLALEMNNIPKLISVNYKYGQLNFQLGQFEEAKRYLLVGDSLLKEYTSIPFEDFYAELMYKVEKALGNIDNSLYYYELSQELIKNKNLETAKNNLFAMQMDEQFQEFQQKIQSEVQIRKNRFWLLILVGILLIVVFVLVFVREENKLKMEKLEKYKIQLDKDRVVLLNKSLEVKMQKLSEDLEEKLTFEIQKNEMLSKTITALQNEIEKHDSTPSESATSSANDVQYLMIWDNFLKESNMIDPGFQDRLDNLFPNLTYKDRRLCVLLKFELSTKEIASVLGQSVRSVEIARTRLRKKLGIDNSDAKLHEFIRSI
jgi:DNA-binding CsgD family transcriptional regulator